MFLHSIAARALTGDTVAGATSARRRTTGQGTNWRNSVLGRLRGCEAPDRARSDAPGARSEQHFGAARTAATANAPITMRERLGTSADAYHARHPLQTQEQERMHVQIICHARIAIIRAVQLPLQFPPQF